MTVTVEVLWGLAPGKPKRSVITFGFPTLKGSELLDRVEAAVKSEAKSTPVESWNIIEIDRSETDGERVSLDRFRSS